MKPKLVSIAYEPESNMEGIRGSITALDDTGQMWFLSNSLDRVTKWKKFPEYEFDTGYPPVGEKRTK